MERRERARALEKKRREREKREEEEQPCGFVLPFLLSLLSLSFLSSAMCGDATKTMACA